MGPKTLKWPLTVETKKKTKKNAHSFDKRSDLKGMSDLVQQTQNRARTPAASGCGSLSVCLKWHVFLLWWKDTPHDQSGSSQVWPAVCTEVFQLCVSWTSDGNGDLNLRIVTANTGLRNRSYLAATQTALLKNFRVQFTGAWMYSNYTRTENCSCCDTPAVDQNWNHSLVHFSLYNKPLYTVEQ